jgi:hypothetical protein
MDIKLTSIGLNIKEGPFNRGHSNMRFYFIAGLFDSGIFFFFFHRFFEKSKGKIRNAVSLASSNL